MRNLQANIGVKYETIGDTIGRARVLPYHESPNAVDRTEATAEDINGLSASDKLNIDGTKAKFAIGFEVEKRSFFDDVKEYPLFKGFEDDSRMKPSQTPDPDGPDVRGIGLVFFTCFFLLFLQQQRCF